MSEGVSSKRRNRALPSVSIRAHLVRYLLIFLAVVLLGTWLFQVGLLNFVYEKTRENDLENAADILKNELGSDSFEDVAYNLAMDRFMSVIVFQINGGKATRLFSQSYTFPEKHVPGISPQRMGELYAMTVEAGGELHLQLTFGGYEVRRTLWDKVRFDVTDEKSSVSGGADMVYIYLCQDADGRDYMLFLNVSLEPLLPMVNTMQQQLILIFVILIVFALLLSALLSKRIVAPIVHMNEAAKQLAQGNYDANFGTEFSYRETQELAETLTYASQELSKTDQLQKELIANISHDLRTPLTMIRGYGEVMRDIPGENTPENIQVLIDETEHLSKLVNDLLDLSKLQSGVRCPEMTLFNITEAVREVLARYEAFTKAQGYHISFECSQDLFVFADRDMILQVIYNLISNAINYTGEDLSIWVTQAVINNNVRISVRDSGEGIPEDQLPMIWDRYYKVDRVHRMAKVGTGLGLSIVKGVLTVHCADFGVESKVGEGSEFWFELPIQEPPRKDTTPNQEELQ